MLLSRETIFNTIMKLASKTVTNRLLELSSSSISTSKAAKANIRRMNMIFSLLKRCFNDVGNLKQAFQSGECISIKI